MTSVSSTFFFCAEFEILNEWIRSSKLFDGVLSTDEERRARILLSNPNHKYPYRTSGLFNSFFVDAPFVGRQDAVREILQAHQPVLDAVKQGKMDFAFDEQSGLEIPVIFAAPGIGKSRLLHEIPAAVASGQSVFFRRYFALCSLTIISSARSVSSP